MQCSFRDFYFVCVSREIFLNFPCSDVPNTNSTISWCGNHATTVGTPRQPINWTDMASQNSEILTRLSIPKPNQQAKFILHIFSHRNLRTCLILLSNEADAMIRPLGENRTWLTGLWCPVRRAIGFLEDSGSHKNIVQSSEPVTMRSFPPQD